MPLSAAKVVRSRPTSPRDARRSYRRFTGARRRIDRVVGRPWRTPPRCRRTGRTNRVMDVAKTEGFCDERFTSVRETLEANLDSGADVGASVAVFLDGEPVVDLWGGETHAGPWRRDTITNVWSITKTMT